MTDVDTYPGSNLCATDVLRLADNYHTAALHMLEAKWATKPKSSAPFRLVAIHAIELYLNAYLLACGNRPQAIRGMQHDLSKRAQMAKDAGLVLPTKTFEHLRFLNDKREYLVSRYGSFEITDVSQANRLKATLDQVRSKAWAKVEQSVTLEPA